MKRDYSAQIWLMVIVFLTLMWILMTSVTAIQETCPQDGSWTKVDSDDLTLYPVASASAFCFKAGSDNSQGCVGGLFDTWPQPDGTCSLSHWAYFIGEIELTETPTSTPSTTPTLQPTETPGFSTPTIQPTPTTIQPTNTPQPPTNTVSEQEWYEIRKEEGEVFGVQK